MMMPFTAPLKSSEPGKSTVISFMDLVMFDDRCFRKVDLRCGSTTVDLLMMWKAVIESSDWGECYDHYFRRFSAKMAFFFNFWHY
jgi:hypothetical protein